MCGLDHPVPRGHPEDIEMSADKVDQVFQSDAGIMKISSRILIS